MLETHPPHTLATDWNNAYIRRVILRYVPNTNLIRPSLCF